jgi:MATE family multidrug resistance protein
MTANITGYAIYQGLATSLDTLCAQAYGSGRKHLVGLQLQRMVYFLWVLTIPIGIVWLSAEKILEFIVPEKDSAKFAGLYLRVLLAGAPGYALFESGKRFVQAQGLFSATTYVLLVAAPLNAFMNWLFVWHFDWGFVGAPIAVAVTDNLLPLFLFLYVYFVDGRQCWNGFTRRAFRNWGPMIKLALPGLLMVEAEFLAFEILTLASSYFSTTHLAAQSILSTLTALTFQIPFPISIAASTRVANLIGATLSEAAKTSAKVCREAFSDLQLLLNMPSRTNWSHQVAFFAASLVGIFNVILLSALRNYIPQLFTNDADVVALVARVLPICAAFQLFDALAANCNGLLRGLGKQEIGGWVNLFCYYAIAMPISFGTAFGLDWELEGLWTGVAIALGL